MATKTGPGKAAASKAGARGTTAKNLVPIEALEPAPVVLVTGGEDVLAERAVATVIAKARDADPEVTVERLDAAGYETGRLELLASPSLFGGGSLVVIENAEASNDAMAADLLRYLTAPPADVCLVVRHSGGVRAKSLVDAARKAGAVEASAAPITKDEEKVDFATAEFRRLGRKASPQAVRALVDAVGSDLRELAAACSQLASDAVLEGDGRVEVDTVELWFGGRVEVTGFKVADAAVAGRADQALSLLRHALATGADPVPLVAAIAMKVRGLAKVSAARRGPAAQLAGELGMAPWQIDRARRELQGWTDDGLAEAVVALAAADEAVKGGGRDPVYAVEKAILRMAAARAR